MATEKRERQREQARSRLEAARIEAAKAAKRQQIFRGLAIVVALGVAAALIMALASQSSDDEKASETTTTISESTTSEDASASEAVTLTGPGAGAVLTGDTPCPKADGSSTRTTGFAKAPGMCIDTSKKYQATFSTTKGDMTFDLLVDKAPQTVNNFVVLSRYHFYDGVPFMRMIQDFMVQFGDPSESPSNAAEFGYTIPDEFPSEGEYKVGSLAMANTGAENSGGAQAFIITGSDGTSLPAQYSLFGQLASGESTLDAINQVKSVTTSSNDGAPTEQVTINSITITES